MRVQIKNILCTTDLSESSNRALAYGFALTKEFNAKLFLCHVIDLPSTGMYGDTISYPVGQQDRVINYTHEHLRRLVGSSPIDWEPLITVGHASSEIVRMAKTKFVDLVIASTHGRSGWKRFVLGSVTGRLMRSLPCPLLLVRSHERGFIAPDSQEIKLKRILIGCDFSPDSSLAYEYGLSLAQEFQSELHLAHVIAPDLYEDITKRAIEPEKDYQDDLRNLLKEKLKRLIPQEAHNWCKPKTTLLVGQPYEELLKYAVVQDVDLIVLGVRGHSLMESLFVGSTADRIAREAHCPVLMVRPIAQVD